MGPQFIAKLMGNPQILPAINDPAKKQLLGGLINAGTGMGGSAQQQEPSLLDTIASNVKGWFTGNQAAPSQSVAQEFYPSQEMPVEQPAMQVPEQPRSEGSGIMMQDRNPPPTLPPMAQDNPNISFDQRGQLVLPPLTNNNLVTNKPWAEAVGEHMGVEEQGKKAGELRAVASDEMGNIYSSALNKETTLKHLGRVINSPEMISMRNIPIGQRQEIGYYKKFGTPEQKRIAGKFITDIGEVVKDAAQDFKGQFRVGEQGLVNSMKVNEDDDIDVAIGKWEGMMYMVKVAKERSGLAQQLIDERHMSKADALKMTDQILKPEKIEADVNAMINPMRRVRNKKTGEIKMVPFNEVREMMRRQNG